MRTRQGTGALAAATLALLVVGSLAAPAAAQQWPPPNPKAAAPPPPREARGLPATLANHLERIRTRSGLVVAATPLPGPAVVVDENEPNDSLNLAVLIAFGDTVTGTVSPAYDVDFFAVDLAAGTLLEFMAARADPGSPLVPYIGLFDADTVYVTDAIASDSSSARILYVVPATGRYFLGVTSGSYGSGGSTYTYRLTTGSFTVDETEPNNTAATATPVTMDDTTLAAMSVGDVDYFAVDVPASTYLAIQFLPVTYWIAAEVTLYDTDGTTPLLVDTTYSGPEARHWVSTGGRYYVAVRGIYDQSALYGLKLRSVPIGPGDPTTLFAGGLGYPIIGAAGLTGEFFVIDSWDARLLRVASSGSTSVLATGAYADDIVVDGYGNVLMPSYDQATGQPGIWRIDGSGNRTAFAMGAYTYALAVGPDGDVWALACAQVCPMLQRFDAEGRQKTATSTTFNGHRMAFSPAGVLHVIDGPRVVAVTQNSAQTVIQDGSRYFLDLAFDRDGYLYLTTERGEVLLYDPSYQVSQDPFAITNLGIPMSVLFARDATGGMTSRLLVVNANYGVSGPFAGALVELNPTGVRAAGHPVQPRLLRVGLEPLSAARMGQDYADTLRVLDTPGPFTWQVTTGALPDGLSLDPATGVLAGVPAEKGTFAFGIRVEGNGRFGAATLTVQVGEPSLVVSDVTTALLGVAGVLTADEERFLDLQGNKNGQFDIGDVRAYLRARGQLPVSLAAPVFERKEDK